jgi:hypothetical protein
MADREARLKQLEEQKNSVKEEPKYTQQDVVPTEPSKKLKIGLLKTLGLAMIKS